MMCYYFLMFFLTNKFYKNILVYQRLIFCDMMVVNCSSWIYGIHSDKEQMNHLQLMTLKIVSMMLVNHSYVLNLMAFPILMILHFEKLLKYLTFEIIFYTYINFTLLSLMLSHLMRKSFQALNK